MVETTHTRNNYETNDFSAVNQFIDDEKRFAESFRSRIRATYLRMALLSLSIFIVCLGIFLLLGAYAYHIYKSEKIIEKVIYEERVITENIDKKPFQQIEQNKENNLTSESPKAENNIKKDYTIFSQQVLFGENGKEWNITTGNKFKKDEYDKPFSKFCYTRADSGFVRIGLYTGQYLPASYDSKYRQYISRSDFKGAQDRCLMNEY